MYSKLVFFGAIFFLYCAVFMSRCGCNCVFVVFALCSLTYISTYMNISARPFGALGAADSAPRPTAPIGGEAVRGGLESARGRIR